MILVPVWGREICSAISRVLKQRCVSVRIQCTNVFVGLPFLSPVLFLHVRLAVSVIRIS